MNETLILILGENPADPISWGRIQKNVLVDWAQNASLFDARGLGEFSQTLAVMAGECVAMREAASPPRSDAKFRAAAKLLMEDELAEAPETLHIATARAKGGAGFSLAIKRSLLDEWINAFDEAGLSPDIIVPDFCAFDTQPNAGLIVFDGVRMVASFGDTGFAAERPLADEVLETVIATKDVQTIDYLAIDGSLPQGLDGIETQAVLGEGVSAQFELIARAMAKTDFVNLRQGAYRKATDWKSMIAPWKRAAMLACACGLGLFAMVGAEGLNASRNADAYEERAQDMHNSTFPKFSNLDPGDHARRMLFSSGTDVTFAKITNAVAASVEEADDVLVDRIRFDADRKVYSVNIRFEQVSALEEVKAGLARRSIPAEEAGGVRRSGEQFIGELEIKL